MADQKKRSDLIRSQIENLLKNAPQPYTQAEKDQIMKGRGKTGTAEQRQKDLDAGRATIEARNAEIRDLNKQVQSLNDQLGQAETAEDASGRTAAADARKEERRQQAASPLGVGTELAASLVAPVAGYASGQMMGRLGNALSDRSQRRKNTSLEGVAEAREKGLVTARAAREAAERSGAMPSKNSALRVTGRMLPHIVGGALSAGKGALVLNSVEDDDPFYSEMAKRGVGLGLIGAGGGILQTGAEYALSPGEVPNAKSIAVIESEQLRRATKGPADAKAPTARAALVEQAKAAGIKNIAKKNMTQLQAALKTLPKPSVLGPLAIPAAAGAIAFGATPETAEASVTGEAGAGNLDKRLTNAGLAAGGTYGISRLMSALGRKAPTAMKALGAGMQMTVPFMAADAYDPTQEQLNMDRNWAARTWPEFMQLGYVGEARDMAQVPQPNPERMSMGPRVEDPGSGDAEFNALVTAAEQDPEIAAMVQQMIQERLAAQPVQ